MKYDCKIHRFIKIEPWEECFQCEIDRRDTIDHVIVCLTIFTPILILAFIGWLIG